jgi:hypothetical protein
MPREMKDIYEEIIEVETQTKLANVQRRYEDDPVRIELLDKSVDHVKTAMTQGELPAMNSSEVLSMAVELTEGVMLEKEAEEWNQVGLTVSELLAEHFDIGPDDIEKIASEEEADMFGRFCARVYATHVSGEDYLSDFLGAE